ncbi:hypothetical protein Trydic_g9405 [Trypoxylus dichotomus]
MNYILSFCKITGASRIFKRNFYLPLLKPQTPKDALRTFKITGKWLLGSKVQHYMPVLFNHRSKRPKTAKDYGKITHKLMKGYTYLTPIFDASVESHQLLMNILKSKRSNGSKFVYTVQDKKHNLVFNAELELAIRDGDVIDVLISQSSNKILIKLKDFKKVPMELDNCRLNEPMFNGEGATTPEEEKFHHYGKFTMSLARMFEEKERELDEWEMELVKIINKRKKQHGEGTIEWEDMVREDTIFEQAEEEHIGMEIADFEITKDVSAKILEHGSINMLPKMSEIPEVVRNMGKAVPWQISIGDPENLRILSGIKVPLCKGREVFVAGQMVKTDDGEVFVPGQTIENEFGLEYAPGITVNLDNRPTLITGLIMSEENNGKPMFLPTDSTITADGQLTFTTNPEERPKPINKEEQDAQIEEKVKVTSEIEDQHLEDVINEVKIDVPDKLVIDLYEESITEDTSKQSDDNLTEDEDIKDGSEHYEIHDGMGVVIASVEEKKSSLQKKLEELRKLTVPVGDDYVTYVSLDDAQEVASKITDNKDKMHKLSEILLTLTRRASTFRERNSVNIKNINNPVLIDSTVFLTEADENFHAANATIKIALKSAVVAANDVFKKRPKDQVLALNTIGEMIGDTLKGKEKLLEELCLLMNTPIERNEISSTIFKVLTQDIKENKVDILKDIIKLAEKIESFQIMERMKEILADGDIMTTALKKLSKVSADVLYFIIDNVEEHINTVKTEIGARHLLESSVVEAVTEFSEEKLQEFVILSSKDEIKDFVTEGVGLAKALGLQEVSENLDNLLAKQDINVFGTDKACLDLLKRLIIIRKLAERDYSSKTALQRIRKNQESGRIDPRIRELVVESAALMRQSKPVKSSKEIPLRLFRTENFLAIEEMLVRRNRLEQPILISRNGIQAVVPKEAARGVLAGRVSYILIDESGCTHFKPMHMFNALKMSKNREKRYENYAAIGGHERLLDGEPKKTREQVYTPPKRSTAEKEEKNIRSKVVRVSHVLRSKMNSLYKPVYLKGEAMATCHECTANESPIPTKPASPPHGTGSPPAGPHTPITDEDDAALTRNRLGEDDEFHIPLLISRRGVNLVYPHEATRAVLTGKVPYYYADDKGCTKYEPMHMFHALRMKRKDRDRYGEYPLVGGHERFLPRKEGYRRNYCYRRPFAARDYGEIYGVKSYGCIGVFIY